MVLVLLPSFFLIRQDGRPEIQNTAIFRTCLFFHQQEHIYSAIARVFEIRTTMDEKICFVLFFGLCVLIFHDVPGVTRS